MHILLFHNVMLSFTPTMELHPNPVHNPTKIVLNTQDPSAELPSYIYNTHTMRNISEKEERHFVIKYLVVMKSLAPLQGLAPNFTMGQWGGPRLFPWAGSRDGKRAANLLSPGRYFIREILNISKGPPIPAAHNGVCASFDIRSYFKTILFRECGVLCGVA